MLASLAFALLQEAAPKPSWPCWRGPDGTNVSAERGWSSQGKTEPLWMRLVGRGHSSFAVEDERLYTLGFDEERKVDVIWCLDASSGEELWSFEYPAELDADGHGGGTHTTPAVAGGRVYCTERRGVARALDAVTGKVLWTRDLGTEADCKPTDYGFGGSPLVLGDRVIVNAARVLALDRESGETLWQTDDVCAYYSTPAFCTLAGEETIASFTRLGLYTIQLDGAIRHFFPWRKGETSVSASTPVVVDAERLFISAGYGHGAALIDFSDGQPVARWETKAMRTQLSGCVLVDGCLYGFDETMLKCLDLEGKECWRTRGLGMGALTAADHRLIVLSGNGELVVVAAEPEKYRELTKQTVLTGTTFWASPVLCGGRIYVRSGEGELACLDHRAEDSGAPR